MSKLLLNNIGLNFFDKLKLILKKFDYINLFNVTLYLYNFNSVWRSLTDRQTIIELYYIDDQTFIKKQNINKINLQLIYIINAIFIHF